MQKNHAVIAGIVTGIAMLAGIMAGVKTGNALLSVLSFIAGTVLLVVIQHAIDVVIEDEWTRLVEQRASKLTLNLTMIIFTIAGLVLITVSSSEQNYDQAAYTIAAVLVTLAILYVAATVWYSHVLRGSDP